MNKEKIYSKIPYGLYAFAAYLLMALVLSVAKIAPAIFGPGVWLYRSFGIIAFYIPLYFALCGLMAGREEIPLKSLFRLNLSFLPFFTVSLMIHVISKNVDLLIVAKITESFGRVIASLVLFFLAGLEVLVVTKLSDLLFPDERLTLSAQLRKGALYSKGYSQENRDEKSDANRAEIGNDKTNTNEAFATPDFPEALVSPLCMPNLVSSPGLETKSKNPELPKSGDLIKSILNGESVRTKDFQSISEANDPVYEEYTPDSFYDGNENESEETIEFFLEDPAISFLSESTETKSDSQSVLKDIENIRTDEKLNYLISSLDSVLDSENPSIQEETHSQGEKTLRSNGYNVENAIPEEDRDNIGIDHKFAEAKSFDTQGKSSTFREINYDDLENDINKNDFNDEIENFDLLPVGSDQSVSSKEGVSSKPVSRKSPQKNRAYSIPIEGVLNNYPGFASDQIDEMAEKSAHILEKTLEEFNIEAKVTGIKQGPVITMFEILPSPGVKLSKIVGLQDNIALRLAASRIRIVAPIPGKHAVGIEIPNKKRELVSFQSILEKRSQKTKDMALPFFLGTDIGGGEQVMDLAKTPHLLIAGATGSGKSVCVNSLICSLLYEKHPNDVKMILVDPKIVELKLYNDIPHLLTPVITETKKALQALQWALYEMEKRYSLLDGMGVREIVSYNKKIKERDIAAEKLPYILIVIDEFADLMATAGKELEGIVARLAAMARAVGIHLVLATQRPSTNVITGLIKANFPSRIAFMVAQMVDSRIIIDTKGAEKLLGKGDMLFTSSWDPFPTRLQGAFLSEDEVERVCNSAREWGKPNYIDDEIFYEDEEDDDRSHLFGESSDPLFNKAMEIIYSSGKASASYLQRRLQIGYNRAARIIEEMEDKGIVGPANGSKARDVIGTHSSFDQSSAGY